MTCRALPNSSTFCGVIKMAAKKKVPEIRFKGFDGEWGEKNFFKVFSMIPNNTLSRADLNYSHGKAKNIHYGDVLIKFGEVLNAKSEIIPYVSDDLISEKLKTSRLLNGDVIIADTAEDETVGKCTELSNVADQLIVSGLHTIACRTSLPFASSFLGYSLNSNRYHDQLLRLMQGTKVLSISKSALLDTIIRYPEDIRQQSQIGTFFQHLDSLITLNQSKYDKLVTVKKAMLQKMFPQEGADVPEIRFKGFKGKWERRTLGKVSDSIEYGLNASAMEFDGKNKYLRITDIDDNSHEFKTNDLTTPNADLSLAEGYRLFVGDILFARTGASVGKTYIYKNKDGLVYFAGFLIRARINSGNCAEFIYQSTLTKAYNSYILITSQRSGQPGINAQEYGDYNIKLPELAEQQKIAACFTQLDSLIALQQRQLEKLKSIKKACLEKMFV